MNNYIIDPEKAKRFFITTIAIFLGIFLFFRSIQYVAPFLVALVLSMFLEPLVKLLVAKVKIPRKIASIVCIVLVLTLIGLAITFLVSKLIIQAKEIFEILPIFLNDWYTSIINFLNSSDQLITLPQEVLDFLVDQLAVIVSSLANFANNGVRYLVNTAISLPTVLIFVIITLFSTYFFLGDKENFKKSIRKQLPSNLYDQISFIKSDVISQIVRLIRAYILIMFVTFTELLIGFSIMRVEYAVVLAVIIAIFDILPVLGTGGVLIPWAIISLITGDIRLGISLIILYLVVLVVRQVVEPKIIGAQIGVHPLMTLGAMYIGLQILGAGGLILGPVTLLIIKSIFAGVFKGKNLKELLFIQKS